MLLQNHGGVDYARKLGLVNIAEKGSTMKLQKLKKQTEDARKNLALAQACAAEAKAQAAAGKSKVRETKARLEAARKSAKLAKQSLRAVRKMLKEALNNLEKARKAYDKKEHKLQKASKKRTRPAGKPKATASIRRSSRIRLPRPARVPGSSDTQDTAANPAADGH